MRTLFVALILAAPLGAQTIVLRPANGTLRHEFSFITTVRELADGRVLIPDQREVRILVGDFAANTVTPVGRVGDGPGEFRRPQSLFAIGGDSTIMKDAMINFRVLLFARDSIVATLPTNHPTAVAVSSGGMEGADTIGRVLALQTRGRGGSPDSGSFVVRFDRRINRTDTIARLANRPATPAAPANAGATVYTVTLPGLDRAKMFPDGWVALVRADPYRVDWCAPNTKCTAGTPLRPSAPRMTDAIKQAWLDNMETQTRRVVADTRGWPELLPALAAGLVPSPDGRILVERFPQEVPFTRRYDAVDRSGRITGSLALPYAERIIGFGTQSVYIVATDANGLQKLRRHPWP